MQIDVSETHQRNSFILELGCAGVRMRSVQKVSGFMPEPHPKVKIVVGNNAYEFKYPACRITNLYLVNIEQVTIKVGKNIWGNKLIIKCVEIGLEIVIQSPFNFLGIRISRAPLLYINGEGVSYSIVQTPKSSQIQGRRSILKTDEQEIALVGAYSKEDSYDFVSSVDMMTGDKTIDTVLGILIFHHLYISVTGIMLSEIVSSNSLNLTNQ